MDEALSEARERFLSRVVAWVVVRLRFLIVAGWIAAAVVATVWLPPLHRSQGEGLSDLVATGSPAYRAQEQTRRLFRVPILADTEVVQRSPNGLSTRAQMKIVRRAVETRESYRGHGVAFALPVLNTLGLMPASRERSTTAVTYLFYREHSFEISMSIAHAYAGHFRQPADSLVGVTGAVPARLEQYDTIQDSLLYVALATVAVIALLVGLSFRALGAPLVVLAAGGIGYLIDVRLLGWISESFDIAIPSEIEPLLVVLLLGITTDYGIFYLSRQRRLLAEGEGPIAAARGAATAVTPIVLTAGLIVAAGTAAIVVGDVGFIQAFGPGLALTAILSILVAITLVPAALALFGRAVFWPSLEREEFWSRTAQRRRSLAIRAAHAASSKPAAFLITCLCVLVLGAAASGLAQTKLGFGVISGLPNSEAKQAADAASKGFAPGILAPTQVVVRRAGIVTRRAELADLERLIEREPGVAGVLGPREQPLSRRPGAIFSANGNAARYAVILGTDPYEATAISNLRQLEDDLPALAARAGLGGAQLAVSGGTALASDTIDQLFDDLVKIALIVLAIDFFLLAVFLRALVAPLYLLAASVLALAATLGLTTYVFQDLLGYDGLTYYVPFAVAVLLVSLGSDYNVFVTGRIWEAARRRSVREAVAVAAPDAARAITIAGLVLAFSFALLVIIPLRAFAEFAFAMGVGLLIDAFFVRSFLVPALVSLVGEQGGWPGGRLKRPEPELSEA